KAASKLFSFSKNAILRIFRASCCDASIMAAHERDRIHTDAGARAGAAGSDEEPFAAAGFGFQHVQHGWKRRVPHDSVHPGGAAGATGAARLAGGRATGDLRRDDLVRTGCRAAWFGRKLSLLARNVWAAALGTPIGVSFHLAVHLERTIGGCVGQHRVRGVLQVFHAAYGEPDARID